MNCKLQISNCRFKRADTTATILVVAIVYAVVVLLASLAYGQGKEAVYIDTKTHKILAPQPSSSAAADLDATSITTLGFGGGGGGGGTNIPVGRSLWVDGVNGSDDTALRGRFDKPFLTVAAAVAAATAGDAIYLGPGTFTFTTYFQLPTGCALLGAGRDVTTLSCPTCNGSTGHAFIGLSTGCVVADLTVNDTVGSNATPIAPIGASNNDVAFTSAVVRDCKVIGNLAGFYLSQTGSGGLKVYDTTISVTGNGIFASAGGVYEFFNCDIISDGSVVGGATTPSGVDGAGGTVRMYGGTITITSQASPIGLRAIGGTIEAHNVRVSVAGTGTPLDASQSTGSLSIDDVTRPDGAPISTSGTVANLLPSVFTTGTPTVDQLAIFTDATHVKGVTGVKGGTTGQFLKKLSNTDYDYAWGAASVSSITDPDDPTKVLQYDLSGFPTGTTRTTTGTGYVISGGAYAGLNLADATTYYFGYCQACNLTAHTTYSNAQMVIPKTGTITRVDLDVFNTGTNGTNESVSHYLRKNDTTDTTLATNATYDQGANTVKHFSYTGLSIQLATGDTIALKVVTPTWATNPSIGNVQVTVWIQ